MNPHDASREMVLAIKSVFERNRSRVFIVDTLGRREFTYGELEDLSLRAAGMLRELGLRKGDRISIIMPNCIEYIVIYFACMHTGVIPVPVNQRLHTDEMKYIISNAEAKCLFISSRFEEAARQLRSLGLGIVTIIPGSEAESPKAGDWLRAVSAHAPLPDGPLGIVEDGDTIIIVFTSGTTNRPKGVQIRYKEIIGNGKMFAGLLQLESRHRFFAYLDLAYLGGFYNLMLIPFIAEGSIVLQETFSPRVAISFWDMAIKHGINAIWLVPSIASILLSIDRSKVGSEYSREHVEKVLIGTAPLPEQLKKSFEERYHVELYENYGLSETFFISTNHPGIGEPRGVGKVVPGCSVRILDDAGHERGACETGEIVVRSSYLMKGYYKMDEKGAFTRDGWFRTGDMGYLDRDGYLFVTDRKKDLIIRGGINISPKEIEDVIARHPGISAVAVVGMPDRHAGEQVVAVVNGGAGLDKEELLKHCKSHLAPFKIPESIFSSDELPRSVTGKINKKELRRLLLEGALPELPARSKEDETEHES
ncbi:MAG: acyl--CoA ligase [Euryarchaeota archaeon]|nr:acyl--CoA ligase [Euryarchaeota archaeon]